MPSRSQYSAGRIDSSIHDFLADSKEPPRSMRYALVTCLDSSFDLPKLIPKSPALRALGNHGRIVGNGLLVTTNRLLAAERRERIFFGFDEVWFFPEPKLRPKPKQACLVSPVKLTQESIKPLCAWMKKNGCTLGLGDGADLNFLAKLRGIAKYLVNQCVEASDFVLTG